MSSATAPAREMCMDAFGPLAVASAEFGFWYLILVCDPCTGMAWLAGDKNLTTEAHVRAVAHVRVLAKPYHRDNEVVVTDSLNAVKRSWAWKAWGDEAGVDLRNTPGGAHWLLIVERYWQLWPAVLATLESSGLESKHAYMAFRHILLLACIVQSRVGTRDGQDVAGGEPTTSSYYRFYGHDFPVQLLEPFGCPLWYVLAPEFVGSKFMEHARPGRYMGTSLTCGWDAALVLTAEGHHIDVLLGQCRLDRSWATEPSINAADERLRGLLSVARVRRPTDANIEGPANIEPTAVLPPHEAPSAAREAASRILESRGHPGLSSSMAADATPIVRNPVIPLAPPSTSTSRIGGPSGVKSGLIVTKAVTRAQAAAAGATVAHASGAWKSRPWVHTDPIPDEKFTLYVWSGVPWEGDLAVKMESADAEASLPRRVIMMM